MRERVSRSSTFLYRVVHSSGGLTIGNSGTARGPWVSRGPMRCPWYLFHRLF
ncbi:unnamed protein product [Staurois parvus]|uniref:Uncharacterized protein n=1 Tax=Staurois parvus TaxID=386267 RepID=A0ABN9FJ86_9NEOB|nr:unnamed protein product [Staurois parvus]